MTDVPGITTQNLRETTQVAAKARFSGYSHDAQSAPPTPPSTPEQTPPTTPEQTPPTTPEQTPPSTPEQTFRRLEVPSDVPSAPESETPLSEVTSPYDVEHTRWRPSTPLMVGILALGSPLEVPVTILAAERTFDQPGEPPMLVRDVHQHRGADLKLKVLDGSVLALDH